MLRINLLSITDLLEAVTWSSLLRKKGRRPTYSYPASIRRRWRWWWWKKEQEVQRTCIVWSIFHVKYAIYFSFRLTGLDRVVVVARLHVVSSAFRPVHPYSHKNTQHPLARCAPSHFLLTGAVRPSTQIERRDDRSTHRLSMRFNKNMFRFWDVRKYVYKRRPSDPQIPKIKHHQGSSAALAPHCIGCVDGGWSIIFCEKLRAGQMLVSGHCRGRRIGVSEWGMEIGPVTDPLVIHSSDQRLGFD